MKKNADIYLNHNEILFTFVLNLFDINPFLLEKIFFKVIYFLLGKGMAFIRMVYVRFGWTVHVRISLWKNQRASGRLLLFRMCMLKGRRYVFFMHVAFIFIYLLLIFWRYTQNVKLFFYMLWVVYCIIVCSVTKFVDIELLRPGYIQKLSTCFSCVTENPTDLAF